MTYTYLITGANRGIGLGLVKELAKKDDVKIIASTRNPTNSTELKNFADSNGKVEIVVLDVSSQESIGKLAAQLEKVAPDGIDFFIGNAAICCLPNRVIDNTYDIWLDIYKTNVLGNVFVFKTVYPYLLKKDTRKVAFTSSSIGSLTQFIPFPAAPYGISKASVNYLAKSLTLDHKDEGFTFVAIHPGVVDTDLSAQSVPFFSEESFKNVQMLTTQESASAMVKIYDSISTSDSGKFYNYDGTKYPL